MMDKWNRAGSAQARANFGKEAIAAPLLRATSRGNDTESVFAYLTSSRFTPMLLC
jgi:hypothetical protein